MGAGLRRLYLRLVELVLDVPQAFRDGGTALARRWGFVRWVVLDTIFDVPCIARRIVVRPARLVQRAWRLTTSSAARARAVIGFRVARPAVAAIAASARYGARRATGLHKAGGAAILGAVGSLVLAVRVAAATVSSVRRQKARAFALAGAPLVPALAILLALSTHTTEPAAGTVPAAAHAAPVSVAATPAAAAAAQPLREARRPPGVQSRRSPVVATSTRSNRRAVQGEVAEASGQPSNRRTASPTRAPRSTSTPRIRPAGRKAEPRSTSPRVTTPAVATTASLPGPAAVPTAQPASESSEAIERGSDAPLAAPPGQDAPGAGSAPVPSAPPTAGGAPRGGVSPPNNPVPPSQGPPSTGNAAPAHSPPAQTTPPAQSTPTSQPTQTQGPVAQPAMPPHDEDEDEDDENDEDEDEQKKDKKDKHGRKGESKGGHHGDDD